MAKKNTSKPVRRKPAPRSRPVTTAQRAEIRRLARKANEQAAKDVAADSRREAFGEWVAPAALRMLAYEADAAGDHVEAAAHGRRIQLLKAHADATAARQEVLASRVGLKKGARLSAERAARGSEPWAEYALKADAEGKILKTICDELEENLGKDAPSPSTVNRYLVKARGKKRAAPTK